MKRKKGIFVNGEWLGGLVVIDELFRTICNISPAIIKEFVQTINEINPTEEEVKITNFQYQNQNSMIIEFGSENLAGGVQLQFQTTDDGLKIVNKNVNIYHNTLPQSNPNGEDYAGNNNAAGNQGGYYQNNPNYPQNYPPNYPNANYNQNYSEGYPNYPQDGMNQNFNQQNYGYYNNGDNYYNDGSGFQNYGNNYAGEPYGQPYGQPYGEGYGGQYGQPYNQPFQNNQQDNESFYNPENPNIPYNPNMQGFQNYAGNSEFPQNYPPNYSPNYPNYPNYPQSPYNDNYYPQNGMSNPQGFAPNGSQGYPQNPNFNAPNGTNNMPANGNNAAPMGRSYTDNPNTPNPQRGVNNNSQPNNGFMNNRQNFGQNTGGQIGPNNRGNTLNNNISPAQNNGRPFNNRQANFNNAPNNPNFNPNHNPAGGGVNNFGGGRRPNPDNFNGIDYSGVLSNNDKYIMETLNANIEKLNDKLDKFNPELFERIAQNIGGMSSNNFGENINNNTIVNNQFGGFPMGGFPGMIDPEIIQQFFQGLADPNSRLSKFYKGYMFPGADGDDVPEQKLMTLNEYLDAEKIAMLKKKKRKRSFNIMSSKGKRDNVNELEDGYFIGTKKIYKWGDPVQLDS